ncbi:DUF7560 family zinc ribbon protein [Natrialba magadii]
MPENESPSLSLSLSLSLSPSPSRAGSSPHRHDEFPSQSRFTFTCDACRHQIEVDDSVAAAIVRHGCPICGSRATAACLCRVAATPPSDN